MMTDPLGHVTQYAYNSHGLVTQITSALGTADEASVQFEFDAADRLTAEIDETGRRSEYTCNAAGRLTAKTLPDADGAGPLSSRVLSYEYVTGNRTPAPGLTRGDRGRDLGRIGGRVGGYGLRRRGVLQSGIGEPPPDA